MANLTPEEYKKITEILYDKFPQLSGGEWVLICFDRNAIFEVVASLYDYGGFKPLKIVLEQMLEQVKHVEGECINQATINEAWFEGGNC